MIPRTVQMAKTVATVLTSNEIDAYGNIILNGYAVTGPNTNNIKAWQYQETTTAPVNLPSVTSYIPAIKGWTTNYMSYFTRPEATYGNQPGQSNPFLFDVWNFYQTPGAIGATGPVTGFNIIADSSDAYVPGVYTVAGVGGSGYGLVAQVTVTYGGGAGFGGGTITSVIPVDGGEGYAVGDFPIDFPSIPLMPGAAPAEKISVASIGSSSVIPAPGYSQCPRRFYQNQVSATTPPQYVNNSQAIAYSFMYPIQTNQTPPPIDYVAA